ncbi:hypothetical protein BN938_0600 [Mucinivorans hirudinis]|uniref:DUF3945 domain-containing protein n=1 Tax=Mucinivorans hirudinis TaxID=1433126 RepID=A0A060R6N7_9BACT|nr:hypothetical protein BN938_0600 [Mucinivorans hirudinis]
MEQKKSQKDVLIVRDEKTGEIGVVAGLGKDGNPKLSPPKVENKGDFLQFNKQDNMLESFFSNFYRQTKEPHRFGFYRVAAENVEQLLDVFKELLKDPEANKAMLEPHKVDTQQYQQTEQTKTAEEVAPSTEKPEQDVAEPKEEKQPYKPIDESRIDWEAMREVYGIDREALEASGDLKKMLGYGKSELVSVAPQFNGERYEMEARLSLKEMPDGSIGIVPHTMRKEPKLNEEFMGHTFTEEDKAALKQSGNMGRVVDLVDKRTGELTPSYISIDRLTNNLEAIAVKDVFISNKIGNTPISKQEQDELRAGRGVKKEIELTNGKKFTTTLQVNADYRGVEFVPRNTQPRQGKRQQERPTNQNKPTNQAGDEQRPKVYKHQWEDEKGNIRAPKTMGGVELSPDQQQRFTEGKAILVKDMMRDGKGEPYTAYVKYSHEAGKPKYYKTNPDVLHKQEVAPTAEHRTQVAVNSQGKTNEATKHVGEPLKQGQTQPTEQQQRRQNKPKMGM